MAVSIVSCDLDLLAAAADDPNALASRVGATPPADWDELREHLTVSRDRLRSDPKLAGWWAHIIVDRDVREVVGLCSYKGPPAQGVVEIAYVVAPSRRGRGYATGAALGLIEKAFADPRVKTVIAHTLPERNASTHVLETCGMTLAGEVNLAEDGLVWRWELDRHA